MFTVNNNKKTSLVLRGYSHYNYLVFSLRDRAGEKTYFLAYFPSFLS